jgi:hypothetical protein
MSMTYEEAAYDDYLTRLYRDYGPEWAQEHEAELYQKHYVQAIHEFTNDRLQSYYLNHPALVLTATHMMMEMESLARHQHRAAALLFATSSIEITIKHLLVKPILNGLVHNEAVADAITLLTPRETGSDGFRDLLFGVLNKVAGIDLSNYSRPGSNRKLWDEWKQLRAERNRLMHDGIPPSTDTLAFFEAVAVEFVNVLFPNVLRNLGLFITDSLSITAMGTEPPSDLLDENERRIGE